MKLFVIGANGGIGKQTIIQALDAGHEVVAILRNPANLSVHHTNLRIITGDILRRETFEKYLEGIDAVISAIGGKMNRPTTLYSEGNKNLLIAMQAAGIQRGYYISASAIEISPVLPRYVRLAEKYIVQKLLAHGYADQRVMESRIRESGTQWTIMRPPRLTNHPLTGKYRYAVNGFLKNCLKISRADVAHFMLHHVKDSSIYQGIVEIGY